MARPRLGWLREPEVIGPPQCPILHRWTIFERGDCWPKLMIHHFLPNRDDRDVHDHPRGFLTVVLRGSYADLVPCGNHRESTSIEFCSLCDAEGIVVGEVMRAGMVRRRRAEHQHRTRVGADGCWTLVLMGPLRRRWGFWRAGRFWPVKLYEERFGFGMRCGDEEES